MEEISVFCVGEKINKINLEVVERIHKKYKEYFSGREYIKPNEESESIYIEFTNGDNILCIFLRGEEFEVTVKRLEDFRRICESTFKKCSIKYLFDVIDNIFKQFIAVEKEPSEGYTIFIPSDKELLNGFIINRGAVYPARGSFLSDVKNIYALGDWFETRGKAELEVKRRELMTRFEHFRDKCNGDWKPNFEDINSYKYYIFGDVDLKVSWCNRNIHTKFGYFKNREDCEKAIELFGDEIKELF